MPSVLHQQTEIALRKFNDLRESTNDPRLLALLNERIPEIEALMRGQGPQPTRVWNGRKSMRRV